jgi:hypothetical protein
MMNPKVNSHIPVKVILCILCAAALCALGGCQDLISTVDKVLGKGGPGLTSVAMAATPPPAVNKAKGRRPHPATARGAKEADTPRGPMLEMKGKKRPPGRLSPSAQAARKEKRVKSFFTAKRDPFRQPTEVLPSDCLPSDPLCRFDRSQLKLVGIIQIGNGQFKGMVEDPDGRGYFVSVGMQIGNATVTQISNKGVRLRVHKTKEDVLIPLYKEPRDTEEF